MENNKQPLVDEQSVESAAPAAEVQAVSTTPVEDILGGLFPHLVQLSPDPELDMVWVLTLACPQEWVCFGSAQVQVLPLTVLPNGVMLRLAAVDRTVSVDALLAHGQALVTRNLVIEKRRADIVRQQQEAQQGLLEEITSLMEQTGGFPLAKAAADAAHAQAQAQEQARQQAAGRPPAFQAPVAAPAAPQQQMLRPDVTYNYNPMDSRSDNYNDSTMGGLTAPSLEDLIAGKV